MIVVVCSVWSSKTGEGLLHTYFSTWYSAYRIYLRCGAKLQYRICPLEVPFLQLNNTPIIWLELASCFFEYGAGRLRFAIDYICSAQSRIYYPTNVDWTTTHLQLWLVPNNVRKWQIHEISHTHSSLHLSSTFPPFIQFKPHENRSINFCQNVIFKCWAGQISITKHENHNI